MNCNDQINNKKKYFLKNSIQSSVTRNGNIEVPLRLHARVPALI